MQLSVELVVSILASVLAGGTVAWMGNRVVNAELFAHVKRHCGEIDEAKASVRRLYDHVGDFRERLATIEYQHRLDRERSG